MVKIPAHLTPASKKWFKSIVTDFDLESFDIRRLTTACETWDLSQKAAEQVEKEGLTVLDRFNQPKPHPLLTTIRDQRALFLKAVKDLGLDVEAPGPIGRPSGR